MCPRRPWDHPRVCGEQGGGLWIKRGSPGSSPAYAGSSARCRSGAPARRDHPRACGEQRSVPSGRNACGGSSPRVRGAELESVRAEHDRGIIPARAGSRPLPSVRPASRWDHPRACGEQPSYGEHMAHLSGSSPRVRGADLDTVVSLLVDGIIPARAGSSPTTPSAPSTRWDHPRACGEQFSLRMAQLVLSGSSARAGSRFRA